MFSAVKLLSLAGTPVLALAEEAEESSLLSPDQLGHYLATALVTILTLLVTYLILKAVLFKPLIKVIKKRSETIGGKHYTSLIPLTLVAQEKKEAAGWRIH